MVELPLPSLTPSFNTPEPAGTALDAGALPDAKVMVLPLTVKVSPATNGVEPEAVRAAEAPSIRVPVVMGAGVPALSFVSAPVKTPEMPPSLVPLAAAVAPPAAPV